MKVRITDAAARARAGEAELGATAIVAAGNRMALGAVRGVRRQDRHVPGDVPVVGCDGTGATGCADPPPTTVRQPAGRPAPGRARSVPALPGNRDGTTGEPVLRASTAPAVPS
ncbi:substrate-binding domain-containing protein [Streptomyces racemochromogenes]|uniref:substrate-binding domain-containing protein n=1 Tax=Streptomyces racemochromogenes TaxID=67353 RepID=UPI0037703628